MNCQILSPPSESHPPLMLRTDLSDLGAVKNTSLLLPKYCLFPIYSGDHSWYQSIYTHDEVEKGACSR